MTNYMTYRKHEIESRLNRAGFRPLDILVTGATGSGKSTTLNALLNGERAKVGTGADPETMEINDYSLNSHIRLWDSPGLGDGVARDGSHSRKLIDMLYRTYEMDGHTYGLIDVVLVLVDGSTRDMGTVYQLISSVILPNIQKERIIVAINQADMAMKGRHWNESKGAPDSELEDYLEEKAYSIVKRIHSSTGILIQKPVYYSAEKGYNVQRLYDMLIDSIPSERRRLAAV